MSQGKSQTAVLRLEISVMNALNTESREFWERTWRVWRSGALKEYMPQTTALAAVSFDRFLVRFKGVVPKITEFMNQFSSRPDEFMIGFYGERKIQFLITNQRFLVYDNANKNHVEIDLDRIESYDDSGWWTKTLFIRFHGGGEAIFRRFAVPNEVFQVAIDRAHEGGWREALPSDRDAIAQEEEVEEEAKPVEETQEKDQDEQPFGEVLAFHVPAFVLGGLVLYPMLVKLVMENTDSALAAYYLELPRSRQLGFCCINIIIIQLAFGSSLKFSIRRYLGAVVAMAILGVMFGRKGGDPFIVLFFGGIVALAVVWLCGGMGRWLYQQVAGTPRIKPDEDVEQHNEEASAETAIIDKNTNTDAGERVGRKAGNGSSGKGAETGSGVSDDEL